MLVKEEYYDLITSEHRLRSNFMNLIEKVTTPLFDISYLLSQMENIFDITFALILSKNTILFIGTIIIIQKLF